MGILEVDVAENRVAKLRGVGNDHDSKKFGEFIVVDVGVGERDCILEDVLEIIDIDGGREVELIGVCELHVLGFITCVGCDIVQADHVPDGGVAQGIFHGILDKHHGKNEEEVEERLEEEVERQEEENAQTTTCTCMDGMMMKRHGRGLEPM